MSAADTRGPVALIGVVRGAVTNSVQNSLTRNSISIMATSAINAGLGYVYWTAAARLMPASAIGLGSAVTSAMVILSLVVHLGAGAGLIARLPRRRTRADWLLTTGSIHLAGATATLVVAVAALWPLAVIVPPLRVLATNPAIAVWFVLGAVSWTAADLLDFTFIAQRRSPLMFCRNGIASAGKLVALLALIPFGLLDRTGDATPIVATWSCSGIIGVVAGAILQHTRVMRFGRIRLREIGGELRALVRPFLGHHAISVAGMVPAYLFPVVVTARLGAQANGYFYVTWMIGSAIFMISPAVSSAIFAEGSHDSTRLRALSISSIRIILALVIPAIVIVGAGGKLILSIFGHGYADAGYLLLLVLLASALPDAVTNVAVATLRVRRKLPDAAVLNGFMALLAVVLAWILTPWLGIIGAGIAWLSAQSAGTLLVLLLRRRAWPSDRPSVVPVDLVVEGRT